MNSSIIWYPLLYRTTPIFSKTGDWKLGHMSFLPVVAPFGSRDFSFYINFHFLNYHRNFTFFLVLDWPPRIFNRHTGERVGRFRERGNKCSCPGVAGLPLILVPAIDVRNGATSCVCCLYIKYLVNQSVTASETQVPDATWDKIDVDFGWFGSFGWEYHFFLQL